MRKHASALCVKSNIAVEGVLITSILYQASDQHPFSSLAIQKVLYTCIVLY